MNTRFKFSTKRIFTLTLTTLFLNATNMHANITSNISTLGKANDVSGLNTKLGTPAGASMSTDILTANNAISAVNAQNVVTQDRLGTPEFGSVASNVGILGDGSTTMTGLYLAAKGTNVDGTTTAITGGTTLITDTNNLSSISKGISAIEGAGFNSEDHSLKVISDGVDLIEIATINNIPGSISDFAITPVTGGITYTASTNNLSSLSKSLSAIEGTGFVADTNSLVNLATSAQVGTPTSGTIAANVGTLAAVSGLYAQTAAIEGTNATGTVIVGHNTDYTAGTNDLTALSQGLSAIEGTSFNPATDSLKIISDVVNLGATATALSTVNARIGDPAISSGAASISAAIGNPTASSGAISIAAAIGNASGASIAADLLSQGVTAHATSAQVGTLANTSGTATIAGILGDPGAATGSASTLAAMLATIIGLNTTDPVLKATFTGSNAAITTAVTSNSVDAPSIAALAAYNISRLAAIAAAATATATGTQNAANSALAVTAINTAITDFSTLQAAWTAAGDGADERPSSAYTSAQINAALAAWTSAMTALGNNQA